MIEYVGQINLANENFGQTEKTITANEVVRTADTKALAREIHHQNQLIPESVAETVLQCFCQAAVEKMSEGFAIQLLNGNDVAMRIFPDLHIKGGNINLKRAKELMPDEVTDEQSMVDHAGDLIDRAGVKVSVRAVVQQKFTDLLDKEGYQLKRTGIVTKQYNPAEEDGESTETPADNTQTGSNTGNISDGGGNSGGSDEG